MKDKDKKGQRHLQNPNEFQKTLGVKWQTQPPKETPSDRTSEEDRKDDTSAT
jgi:hypothetical protein